MAGMGVYIVLLTTIGVAALPINRFKLPQDYHAKDFIHELSKQSPNYEKVGQFFKGFYLALNGLKDMDKVDEFRYHGNSSVYQMHNEGISSQRLKDPRRREIAKSVNVSIVLLTPSPDILEKSLGYHKKEIQHLIDVNTDYAKVLNRSKKHHKLDEKISVALPASKNHSPKNHSPKNHSSRNHSKKHHKLDEKIKVALPVSVPKAKTFKDRRPLLGIASFLLWLTIVGFLFYYFCSNKQYKRYFKLKPNSEKVKVTKMALNMPSEPPSSEEEDRSEKKGKHSKKTSFSVKFASDGSEDASRAEDDSQSASARPRSPSIEKKTRQSLKLLKTLFNKVLSSETIPQHSVSQSESVTTIESNRPIRSQEHYSSENYEKFKLRFSARDTPIHLDLRRSQPHSANVPTQLTQLNAVEVDPHPYFSQNSNCKGIYPTPENEENPRFSTPLIKEDYELLKYDKNGDRRKKGKNPAKKCPKKPLTMDKPILNEDFKNLKDPTAPLLHKEAKKSCLSRKKTVTFSRVIKVQTYVVKTEADKFDKCFHVYDDGSPWFRVYRKSKTPMNSPSNDPLYKFPKGSSKDGTKGGKDGNKNYSIAILLKQKLKNKK